MKRIDQKEPVQEQNEYIKLKLSIIKLFKCRIVYKLFISCQDERGTRLVCLLHSLCANIIHVCKYVQT